ncbi:MAG: hypothetical protein QNK15_12085 [Cycloclasticus sp.]|nr:hypothetical protein [Cycloclasticus sp.]
MAKQIVAESLCLTTSFLPLLSNDLGINVSDLFVENRRFFVTFN